MRILHHYWLSPSSRLIRLFLNEKKIEYLPKLELYWERSDDLLRLNPSGEVPILSEENSIILSGSRVIIEYFEEETKEINLIPGNIAEKAEVRRLLEWFENKFAREVTNPLLENRVFLLDYVPTVVRLVFL